MAVDIGASSGKMLCGSLSGGKIVSATIHRFGNGIVRGDGHLTWDVERLEREIICGLRKAAEAGIELSTIGIDAWGVDFVLLKDGKRLGQAVSYRDGRCEGVVCPLSREEIYRRTGIQHLSFNTIYQLLALKRDEPSLLEEADTFLMIPDYFAYLLTGEVHQEYTNATTTALVDAQSREWDLSLIERLGLPVKLFLPLSRPGSVYGRLKKEIAERVGQEATVLATATHDTASAVHGSPLEEGSAFLSSGTWSLLGALVDKPILTKEAEEANFTNEGGVNGTIRFLRNLTGTWLLQSLKREWKEEVSWDDIAEEAKRNEDFTSTIDIEDERFLSPKSMIEEVRNACREHHVPVPGTLGQLARCVYLSLATGYGRTIDRLEELTGRTFDHLSIVGGGSKDGYLCQLAADMTGLVVTAGPAEGTGLGNLLCQMEAMGEIQDAGRTLRASIRTKTYHRREHGQV